MTEAPKKPEVPEGEFPRWASVAMLEALREIQRLTAYDHSDLGGLLFLTARQAVTRVEDALAGLPPD